jgi:hypothetical protein
MTQRGRPRSSPLSREEQIRAAKRAQRARLAEQGLRTVTLQLPESLAERLRVARHARGFAAGLDDLVERLAVRIADFPVLRELAWNRVDAYIPAEEALALYERNWRFVQDAGLSAEEQKLIDRLTQQCGSGVLNV